MEKKIVAISIAITAFSVWFLSFYLGRYQTSNFAPIDPIEKIEIKADTPNVLRIRNLGCQSIKIGSGFFINPTTIATNRHVVENTRALEITDSKGEQINYRAALISPLRDLAFIKTRPVAEPIPTGKGGTPGNIVDVIGYPLGRQIKTSKGVIRETGRENFLINVKVVPGNSGGPVVLNGQVIGIISKSFGSSAIAISINEILRAERSILKKPNPDC